MTSQAKAPWEDLKLIDGLMDLARQFQFKEVYKGHNDDRGIALRTALEAALSRQEAQSLPELPPLPEPLGGLDEYGQPIWSAEQIQTYATNYGELCRKGSHHGR